MMSTITHTKPYPVPTRGGGGGAEGGKITGARRSGRGPGHDYVHVSLSFSAVSLFVDIQINSFRPSPSHSATESLCFKLCMKIFSRSALVGGHEKTFYQDPNLRMCSKIDSARLTECRGVYWVPTVAIGRGVIGGKNSSDDSRWTKIWGTAEARWFANRGNIMHETPALAVLYMKQNRALMYPNNQPSHPNQHNACLRQNGGQ
jgi:hypothetical protein